MIQYADTYMKDKYSLTTFTKIIFTFTKSLFYARLIVFTQSQTKTSLPALCGICKAVLSKKVLSSTHLRLLPAMPRIQLRTMQGAY